MLRRGVLFLLVAMPFTGSPPLGENDEATRADLISQLTERTGSTEWTNATAGALICYSNFHVSIQEKVHTVAVSLQATYPALSPYMAIAQATLVRTADRTLFDSILAGTVAARIPRGWGFTMRLPRHRGSSCHDCGLTASTIGGGVTGWEGGNNHKQGRSYHYA